MCESAFTLSPTLVCWSKRRTPPAGSVYVLIIYGNFIISFYVCISADTKGVVKRRVGTTDACLLPAFRTRMSRWLRHIAVKQSSWQRLLLTVKTSPWICWVARGLACIALRSDERVYPQLRTRMDASRVTIKPTNPAVSVVCCSSSQTVSPRLHHKLALCLCLWCFSTKDRRGITVRAVRIFYLQMHRNVLDLIWYWWSMLKYARVIWFLVCRVEVQLLVPMELKSDFTVFYHTFHLAKNRVGHIKYIHGICKQFLCGEYFTDDKENDTSCIANQLWKQYVCMYVCMYVCIHACMHVCLWRHT